MIFHLGQKNFDFNKFKQLLKAYASEVTIAKGKDIFFVIGPTGAGKSLAINYLMGHKLRQKVAYTKDETGGEIVEQNVYIQQAVEDQKIAPFDDKVESKTPYPQIYETRYDLHHSKNLPFAFADCPGFSGVRAKEEQRIFESVSTQIAFESVKSIQGMLIVIDHRTLEIEHGNLFKQLSDILSKFLTYPEHVADSIVFVFTHLENMAPSAKFNNRFSRRLKNTILHKVKSLIKKLEEKKADHFRTLQQLKHDANKKTELAFNILTVTKLTDLETKQDLSKEALSIVKANENGKENFYIYFPGKKPIKLLQKLYLKLDFPDANSPAKQLDNQKLTQDMLDDIMLKISEATFTSSGLDVDKKYDELITLENKLNVLRLIAGDHLGKTEGTLPGENIVLLNPFDDGYSRRILFERLMHIQDQRKINPIDKKQFNFAYDIYRCQFDNFLSAIALEAISKINQRELFLQEIRHSIERSKSYKENIKNLQFSKTKIEELVKSQPTQNSANQLYKGEKTSIISQRLQKNIQQKKHLFEENNLCLQGLRKQYDETENALNKINTIQPTFLYTDCYKSKLVEHAKIAEATKKISSALTQIATVTLTTVGAAVLTYFTGNISALPKGFTYGLEVAPKLGKALGEPIGDVLGEMIHHLSYAKHKFVYRGGIPLVQVNHSEKTTTETWEEIEDEDMSQGKYEITYKSGWGKDGDAEVHYHIAQKDHPDIAAKLKSLERGRKNIENLIEEKEKKKTEYENGIKDLQKEIENLENGQAYKNEKVEDDLAEEIKKLEEEKNKYEKENESNVNECLQLTKNLENIESFLKINQGFYNIIMHLIELLHYDKNPHVQSNLRDFARRYTAYKNKTYFNANSFFENKMNEKVLDFISTSQSGDETLKKPVFN